MNSSIKLVVACLFVSIAGLSHSMPPAGIGSHKYRKLCGMIPACVEQEKAEADYRKNYWKYYYQSQPGPRAKEPPIPEKSELDKKLKSINIIRGKQ